MAMIPLPRTAFVLLAGALLLAGCAQKQTRPAAPSTTQTPAGAPANGQAPSAAASSAASSRTQAEQARSARDETLPDGTGVPACDDYLASYKGCHRAAHIFAPDQLEDRYQAMRTSLLRDSRDPDIRPQLAARCNSLASQLRQALHGKACEPEPAGASSSP